MAKQKLVSLDEAVQIINEAWGNDPKKSGRDFISKKTIYNAIYDEKIKREGRAKFAMVFVDEILSLWGPKKSA